MKKKTTAKKTATKKKTTAKRKTVTTSTGTEYDADIASIANAVRNKMKTIDVYSGEQSSELGVRNWLKTEIIALDWIVGMKGMPYGRIVEVYGNFSSGKTWLVLLLLAKAQKDGAIVVLIETERSFDPEFAKKMGVDLKRLILIRPETVEEVFDTLNALFRGNKTNRPIAVGWDSIAATPTKHEIETDMETKDMSKAGKMGQGIRKVAKLVEDNDGLFIAVNQVRDKIGVMFGEKEFRPGGKAVEFHASLLLHFKKAGKIHNANKEVIGMKGTVVCTKSKVCPPFREATFEIIPGVPVAKYEGLFGVLRRKGFIVESGKKGKYQFVGSQEDDTWTEKKFLENVNSDEARAAIKDALSQ